MAKLSLSSLPFEKIAALTRVQRIVLCVGTFLLLGGGYFYLIYIPKSGTISELKKDYGNLQMKVAKAKAAARSLDKYQKQYKEAQGKFRLVLRLLPDKKEIPSLLEAISRSGRHSGLEFLLFKPEPEILKGFYAEIPVKIEVIGGYHNLALFFDKVARLSRIVNISNVQIKGRKGSAKAAGDLNTSCVATTFRFVETAKAKPEKGKSEKAR
jgi:type IV pilus assembly protein PilO